MESDKTMQPDQSAEIVLSPAARQLLQVLVSESIAYGQQWWLRNDRDRQDADAWYELYRAGLTRRDMYDVQGITAEAVRLVLEARA